MDCTLQGTGNTNYKKRPAQFEPAFSFTRLNDAPVHRACYDGFYGSPYPAYAR